MEIKQLRTFLTVADAGSFLKAADSLFVTRQALSKTIDQLEEELGVELFLRNQKGAMMTPAGVYFYPRADSVVAEFDRLKSDTISMKRSYRTKINVCMSIGIYDHYATKIHTYRQEHSNEMQISLRCCLEEDAATILTDRKADAVLSFNKVSSSLGESILVGESKIVFLISKKLASSDRNIGINELPKLLYNGGTDHPLWWNGPRGKNDIISSDMNYLYSLLMDGQGIMPMPKISVPDYLTFAIILPAYPEQKPMPVYYSSLKPNHYNILTYAFLDTMFEDVIKKDKLE